MACATLQAMQLRCSALAALRALLAVASASAQDGPWIQHRGALALEVPFANGPIAPHHVPQVWLRLSGSGPRRFGMDTGSTGIVVSAEHYIPRARRH
jgi:hypothetical protein